MTTQAITGSAQIEGAGGYPTVTLGWELPPPASECSVGRGIGIPMRDGAVLLADHYAPAPGADAVGTLLVRTPYGRELHSEVFGRVYAERGYHVLFQSCRGTFGSGGELNPMQREVEDGADTVEWLRKQDWFTGTFGTMGASYLGFTQWAILMDPPPELAAAVVIVAPHDFGRAILPSGALALHDFLLWSDKVAHQEDDPESKEARLATAAQRMASAAKAFPLQEVGNRILGSGAPWYQEWITHPDPADPYWRPFQLGAALDRADVPVLLVGGWQDLFLDQTLEQYRRLHARGTDVALTVGPWPHDVIIPEGGPTFTPESLEWLAQHLQGAPGRRAAPVRLFVTGSGEWQDHAAWPPPAAEEIHYLHPAGVLSTDRPPADAAPSTFTYDPADPTPSVGGQTLLEGGYVDNDALEARGDVLTFTGPILRNDLEVIGVPLVQLAHTSDNPYADIFVRLCEVDPNGCSRNVGDGFLRVSPEEAPTPTRIELDAIAHRFSAGSRIRLQVSGGAYPRFDRNTGTGEPPATATQMVSSRRTIAHGLGAESYLQLPLPTSKE